MKMEQKPQNEMTVYFKRNSLKLHKHLSTVSTNGEYPAHRSSLAELGTSFEHCP